MLKPKTQKLQLGLAWDSHFRFLSFYELEKNTNNLLSWPSFTDEFIYPVTIDMTSWVKDFWYSLDNHYSDCVKIPFMNEIDEQLKQLALEVQKCTPPTTLQESKRRRRALIVLKQLIENDRRFHYCKEGLRNRYSQELGNSLFEECYRDALGQTWLEFLEKYNPERSKVWIWFREILNFRFIDFKNESIKLKKIKFNNQTKIIINPSLDQPVSSPNDSDSSRSYLELLQKIETQTFLQEYAQDLIKVIQEDKYKIFQDKSVQDLPQVNYRVIALKRYEALSWNEIAEELQVKIGTITPFFTRSHQYFRPLFYELLLGIFSLSPSVRDLIEKDVNNKFKNKIFNKTDLSNTQVKVTSFQEIILKKIEKKGLDWQVLAQEIGIPNLTIKLIYFYLDTISYFKQIFEKEFYLYDIK